MQEKINFIYTTFPELLKNLKSDTPAKWGQMNAQQMVEHLADYVKIASGKNPAPVVTSDEHLPAFRKFMESEKEFRENTKNPLNSGPPVALRLPDLESAKEEYFTEMDDFNAIFEKEPGKKTAHPAFGNCTYEDWVKLQYKHLRHHARQFGLIG